MSNTKRVALYVRVSTDDQATENQKLVLGQVAAARGWTIVETYEDAGLSGALGRDKRPGLDRMLKDATAGRFDMVAAWAIDRLGRSLLDLLTNVQELAALNVDLYLHVQQIDSSTPAGKLMLQVFGALAEFERSLLKERIHAGIARARAKGTKSGKAIGRPAVPNVIRSRVLEDRAAGLSLRAIAAKHGLSHGAVGKIVSAERAA
jgi:DNA invertase Pin-like site-specific DNA recombinase